MVLLACLLDRLSSSLPSFLPGNTGQRNRSPPLRLEASSHRGPSEHTWAVHGHSLRRCNALQPVNQPGRTHLSKDGNALFVFIAFVLCISPSFPSVHLGTKSFKPATNPIKLQIWSYSCHSPCHLSKTPAEPRPRSPVMFGVYLHQLKSAARTALHSSAVL